MTMETVTKIAVEGNAHHAGYIFRFQTAQGLHDFLIPAKGVASLLQKLLPIAQAAPSHDLRMALAPLTIESVSVVVLHGQTTLAASTQSGVEMVSTIDRKDLERLAREIQAALATPLPPAQ